jgi:hypothetical protein
MPNAGKGRAPLRFFGSGATSRTIVRLRVSEASTPREQSGTMERNRWETAIRCLEVALHPNTADEEVVAAVCAFRRVVNGRSLYDICAAVIGVADAAANPVATAVPRERLSRENHELRSKLADAEAARSVVVERLRQAQRRLGESHAELHTARDEAAACAQRIAELREAQARTIEPLRRENSELRKALDNARGAIGGSNAASPFGAVLAATLQRSGDHRPGRAGPAGRVPGISPDMRSGWIA